jgi:hypothetical protein
MEAQKSYPKISKGMLVSCGNTSLPVSLSPLSSLTCCSLSISDVSISSDGLTALVVDFTTVCQIDLSTATATSPVQPIVQLHIS